MKLDANVFGEAAHRMAQGLFFFGSNRKNGHQTGYFERRTGGFYRPAVFNIFNLF
ncbi:MAG: hypothetical protein IT260_24265 [Saprospiraceae bacterium]|nr:hypothetical protein [Saprospiraceae bacterium]